MPLLEVIYQLLDFGVYPHKRAVNTLDSFGKIQKDVSVFAMC